MADHGFGGGRLTNHGMVAKTATEEIAKCVSRLPEIRWCHTVLASHGGQDRYHLLWERKKKVDDEDIKEKIRLCADKYGYKIRINTIVVDKSFRNGNADIHP